MVMDILCRAEIDDGIRSKTDTAMMSKKLDDGESCDGCQQGILVSENKRSFSFRAVIICESKRFPCLTQVVGFFP